MNAIYQMNPIRIKFGSISNGRRLGFVFRVILSQECIDKMSKCMAAKLIFNKVDEPNLSN